MKEKKLQDQAQQSSSNSLWEDFRWRERQLQLPRIPGCHRVYTWDHAGLEPYLKSLLNEGLCRGGEHGRLAQGVRTLTSEVKGERAARSDSGDSVALVLHLVAHPCHTISWGSSVVF